MIINNQNQQINDVLYSAQVIIIFYYNIFNIKI